VGKSAGLAGWIRWLPNVISLGVHELAFLGRDHSDKIDGKVNRID